MKADAVPAIEPAHNEVRPYIIRTYDRWIILVLVLAIGWVLFRPLFAFSVYYRGVSYERMLRLTTAERYYRRSTAVYPKIPQGWQAWGELYLMHASGNAKDADEAVKIFSQGLALNPTAAAIAFDLGRTQYARKDFKAARVAFEESARLAPNDMFSWDFAAWSSLHSGDTPRARTYWHKVLKLDPGNEPARRALNQYGS
ncbi:MAG: tetratricopeptide repeat protein [Candidatus Eremiobacter antarcticus]|nr:tetratricopeptide repeat protein [Candidatus Eremiobacteraeota bacterium]MBC5808081.1 tetratricopeptide repeat protein [Candidatus Eremiobacteraeota bacterium]